MNRLYSFVLPAYKARFFKEAVDSILAQTYTNFELIIVNDASPEDLDSIVSSYDDPRIQYYINKENVGGKDLVAQWNNCLQYAQGEYVILASDDDVYHAEYLERMNQLVKKYPYVNAFRPRIQKINEVGEVIGVDGFLKEHLTQLEYVYAQINTWVGSGIPFWIFKKDKLKSIGGFVQYPFAWFSDDATVIECADNGIVTTSDVLFSFRFSGINISTKKQTRQELIKKIDATEQYYRYIKDKLNTLQGKDVYSKYLKSYIDSNYANFLGDDKLSGQLFNASTLVSLSVSPIVCKLEFLSIRRLLRYWLNNTINKLVR